MTESKLVEGKVALVTGAGRGVGAEVAKLLAAHGARVIVNDLGGSGAGGGHDQAPAGDTVGAIRDAGGQAEANFDSVVNGTAARGMVEQALDCFGRIDIVVNNAGILRDAIFHKMSEDDWDAVINVHLKGSFNVSRAAAGHFRKQESGCYVHMTSTSGLIGNLARPTTRPRNWALSVCRNPLRSICRASTSVPTAWPRSRGVA